MALLFLSMTASGGSIDYEAIRKTINSLLDYVLDYTEFIVGEKPEPTYTKTISEVRFFQRKLEAAGSPFLTSKETEDYQNALLPIILYWNNDVSTQTLDYHNALAELGRILEARSDLRSYNPLRNIAQRFDKFLMANAMLNETLDKINYTYIDKPDLYAVFYSLIAAIEVTEYELYTPFNEAIKKLNLDTKYDIDNIFSVTTKRKNRFGDFQSDARMIRNALAHINYDLEMKEDSFTITLRSGSNDTSQDLSLTDTEFFRYVQNHKFLLQNFFAIMTLMTAFSTMRHNFVKSGS